MASILVDDTDPQIQYFPGDSWTPFRIAAEDILSFPSNGLVSPIYGTLHLASNADNVGPVNTSVRFSYIGTNFSAHFRGPLDSSMEDVLCMLDGMPQSVQFLSSIFVCSSNSTPEDGLHQLNVTMKATQVYYFDYLKYTPSMSTPTSDDEDVMFENDSGPVVEIPGPGSSTGFLFDGYSIGLYTSFDGSSHVPKNYDMMYVVDDQPPVFFTFSQPVLAVNPLGEPQLLFQTPALGHGIHNVTLQWLPPPRENQTTVRIQSYVVQNSTSSIALGLSAVPISSQPSMSSDGGNSSPGRRVGVIIGSTIGGIAAAILLVILILNILRRRRRKLTRLSKAGLYFMHRIGPEHISDAIERS